MAPKPPLARLGAAGSARLDAESGLAEFLEGWHKVLGAFFALVLDSEVAGSEGERNFAGIVLEEPVLVFARADPASAGFWAGMIDQLHLLFRLAAQRCRRLGAGLGSPGAPLKCG